METQLQSTLTKKVKERLDPIDQDIYIAVNKWIVTSDIHSKLRMIQREKVRLHTSSKHKETTISHKRTHQKLVKSLKSESKDYSVNAFEDSSAIWISTVKKWIFPCFRVYSKLQS